MRGCWGMLHSVLDVTPAVPGENSDVSTLYKRCIRYLYMHHSIMSTPKRESRAVLNEGSDARSGKYPHSTQRKWLRVDAVGRLYYVAVRSRLIPCYFWYSKG